MTSSPAPVPYKRNSRSLTRQRCRQACAGNIGQSRACGVSSGCSKAGCDTASLSPASDEILDPDHPGIILPDQPHLVEPLGPARMQVEFYNEPPGL